MEKLFNQQKQDLSFLNQIIYNFGKQTLPRSNKKLRSNIQALEKWWKKFNERNTELQPFFTLDQPYFSEDKYTEALQKYSEQMTEMQSGINTDNPITDDEQSDSSSDESLVIEEEDTAIASTSKESEEVKNKISAFKLLKNDVKDVIQEVKNMNETGKEFKLGGLQNQTK